MLILIFENGRLGNQLFQYHGLRKYYPNEKIYFIGFKSLEKICINKNIVFLNNHFFSLLLVRNFCNILFFLFAKFLIISTLSEQSSSFEFKLVKKNGIFKYILLIDNLFFQHKDAHPQLITEIPIINLNTLSNLNFFKQKNNSKKEISVFVHIRRGDYMFWPSSDYPAAISMNWYLNQMDYFRSRYSQIKFIVFTDDQSYISKVFETTNDVIISFEDEIIDFATMANCHHGILSASTFSWWGAYLAKISNPSGEFIAPKYWIGYNKKEWFPLWIETNWLKYV